MDNAKILILAILNSRDSDETISSLTENGFSVTVLGTTGGFLKQKNTTLLIGTNTDSCEKVKSILREKAGVREEPDFNSVFYASSLEASIAMHSIPPIMHTVGGVTAFTIKLDGMEKF